MLLRVYAERSHYAEENRSYLNDLLKPLWNSTPLPERRAVYGSRVDLFEAVDDPAAAHLHVLTMRWQYYVDRNCVPLAIDAVSTARRHRKPIAVFSQSDYEANFPVAGDDIHLFQASGYRSRHRQRNHGMPPFLPDPLAEFGDGALRVRDKRDRAVVGFCGQAAATLPRQTVRVARNQFQRLQWRLGKRSWEPPPFEHTYFRQRVLDTFAKSQAVDTRFVLRVQYRAGVAKTQRDSPVDDARREFIQNVLDTDYTVCMRGGGNYSVRFFEALALGRIPIFIDTDCLLPFERQVDWRRYVIWIDERDLDRAPALVAESHARLSSDEFRERLLECRQLYETRLTPNGFFSHFHEHFPELAVS